MKYKKMSNILADPVLGQKVHLTGGGCGVIKLNIMNFAVPLWEITLENRKTVTEARYRFDLVPSFNPHNLSKFNLLHNLPMNI